MSSLRTGQETASWFSSRAFLTAGSILRALNREVPIRVNTQRQTTEAAYNALLPYFASQPDTLFIAMTAPPLAITTTGKIKIFIKHLLGRSESLKSAGKRIRSFNTWLKDSEGGWLAANHPHKNVAVFDYYNILTGHGRSDWSVYGSEEGRDSHPSSLGNTLAAEEFIPFLNRSVNRLNTHTPASP